MKKLITLLTLVTSTAMSFAVTFPNQLHFDGDKKDLRAKARLRIFPMIFHYLEGGKTSEMYMGHDRVVNFLETHCDSGEEEVKKVLYKSGKKFPTEVKNELAQKRIKPEELKIYRVEGCMPKFADCNYYTHCWAMDRMVEDVKVNVMNGIFYSNNIEVVNGEIGINKFVSQQMSYHDNNCLSPNNARFKIKDLNKRASGWFVSICGKKAIAVYWKFKKAKK